MPENSVASSQESKPAAPDPNEKLVRVFDTQQEPEALIVQGLLDSADIESSITALDAPQDILPGVGGTILRVREEDADEARRIIAENLNSPAEYKAEGPDINAETPTQG